MTHSKNRCHSHNKITHYWKRYYMNLLNITALKECITTLQDLNDQFGIANCVEFKVGRDGIAIAEMTNQQATATISLQGGLIMSFCPTNQAQVLWLSSFAPLDKNKPVRGGVPICWPWFGPHDTDKTKPGHGVARTASWKVVKTAQLADGATQIVLELIPTAATQALWAHETQLQLAVTVGHTLTAELITHNLGTESVVIGEAFHTYFHVGDVSKIAIKGLENCEYLDKMDNSQRKQQTGAITINSQTDRVYFNTTADCVIVDPSLKRQIRIAKQGSQSTVLWNPWETQSSQLGDVGHQGYLKMVCVETANALDNVVTVKAGETHRLITMISVEPIDN